MAYIATGLHDEPHEEKEISRDLIFFFENCKFIQLDWISLK